MYKRPTVKMVEELNIELANEGTCLKYVRDHKDCGLVTFNLLVVDKYISTKYVNLPIITDELDNKIRDFFLEKGIKDIGFRNTVLTIFATEG